MLKYGLSPDKVKVLKNPTTEGAMLFWDERLLGKPASPDAPLAGVHKARLVWPGSSKKMVKESKAWLQEHGYGTNPAQGPSRDVPKAFVR